MFFGHLFWIFAKYFFYFAVCIELHPTISVVVAAVAALQQQVHHILYQNKEAALKIKNTSLCALSPECAEGIF